MSKQERGTNKQNMEPVNNALTRLIDRMHDAILDTEASSRPAGNLFDVWCELKAAIEPDARSSTAQGKPDDKAVELAKAFLSGKQDVFYSHDAGHLSREILRLADSSSASSFVPCGWRYRYGASAWKYVAKESDCNPGEGYQREQVFTAK